MYLAVILIYVFLSIFLSKLIKHGRTSNIVYWLIVIIIPAWFFAGHYLYPSYFEFKSLCESETVNTYSYENNRESISKNVWLVPNRLIKRRFVGIDDSGTVAHEYVSFTYYPFGTKASILGGSSGSPPTESCSSKSNLGDFIKKHINIAPLKQQTIMQNAEVISGFEPKEKAKIERGRSGDIVWCKSRVVGESYNDSPGLGVSYLIQGSPIKRKHTIEKTLCTNEHIYIIQTPKKGKEYIQIYVYDYQGINLENQKFLVPSRVWAGYPRKPLIYFYIKLNQMIIGIEEFGRNMEPERIYYNLKFDQPNKPSQQDAQKARASA